jgi:hypothetical protein
MAAHLRPALRVRIVALAEYARIGRVIRAVERGQRHPLFLVVFVQAEKCDVAKLPPVAKRKEQTNRAARRYGEIAWHRLIDSHLLASALHGGVWTRHG